MNKTILCLALALNCFILLNCSNEETTPAPMSTLPEDPNIGCTDELAKNYKSTAKEEDCSCQYDFSSKINSKTPSEFTKKILIEEHSGTWCGWCPLAQETMRKMAENQRIIGVEVHYNDEMATMEKVFIPLKNKFGYPAYPSGMVNRRRSIAGTTFIMGEQEWKVNVDDLLKTEKTPVGIAIESKLNGKELEVLTHILIKMPTEENYGLGIYLVENDVTGYPQANYASRDTRFSKYEAYNLPYLIENIQHQNVSRDAISPIIGGLDIPKEAINKGKTFRKLFKSTIPNTIKNTSNLYLIAFVLNQKDNQIINAQRVAVGNVKDWD
jgi:Outer membrane protein Omp28